MPKVSSIFIPILKERLYFKLRWFLKHGIRYFKILDYWYIAGWLSENEAIALYDLVLKINTKNPVIVELGSWLGKSSIVLAKALSYKKAGILYCVDSFDLDGDNFSRDTYIKEQKKLNSSVKEQFIFNIKKSKVLKYIKILEGKSYEVAKNFKDQIDLLFIDANHNYDSVKLDFFLWKDFIKIGGFIAFHDANVEKEHLNGGPLRLIKEEILNSSSWSEKKFIDSLFIAKKC